MDNKTHEIIKKVSELYNKYGIKSITMDDVSGQLGISKKTLYEHFSDKSELVLKVIEFISREREDQFCQYKKQAGNALEELLNIYRFYLQIMKEINPSFEFDLKKYYPEIYSKLKQMRRDKMLEATLENLKKGKKEGLYRNEIREEIITRLQLLRVESLSDTDLFTQDELYSKEFVEEMFFYHLYGILSAKGITYLNEHIELIKRTK